MFSRTLHTSLYRAVSARSSSRLSLAARSFSSSYQAVEQDIDDRIWEGSFPSRTNVGINFLPDGHKYIIERFGKFHGEVNPGLQFLVPFVDKIAYVVDKREMCLRIRSQTSTTEDNVMVSLGGNLYIKFFDAEKAAYGATNPIYAASQFAQSVMRTAVGNQKLDKLFSERSVLNETVKNAMKDGARVWGADVVRFEITSLEPIDPHVTDSLNKQSTADRERREKVITAEADKRQTQLLAEAYEFQQSTEARGDAERVRLNASARAYEIEAVAKAEQNRIKMVVDALEGADIQEVSTYLLSQNYITEFGKIAKESTTLVVPQNMNDLASVISTGSQVLDKARIPK